MVVPRQLFQLQELDLEIESHEQALRQKTALLGENHLVVQAQEKLASEQKRLEELKHQQHSAEWEIDDVVSKIKTVEDQLYGGKISNPKELSGLQHEVNTFKDNRNHLETRALEIMDQVEAAEARLAAASNELGKVEDEWQAQQQLLSTEIEQLKNRLSDLKNNREQVLAGIDLRAVESYEKLRKLKGQAVSRVEQGICRGCRISLSSSELQQVRSGNLVQCGSCGRILFLP